MASFIVKQEAQHPGNTIITIKDLEGEKEFRIGEATGMTDRVILKHCELVGLINYLNSTLCESDEDGDEEE